MSSSSDTSVGLKHSCTRSTTQRVEENSAATFHQQHTGWRWSSIPDLTDNYSDEGRSEEVPFYDIWGDDNMPTLTQSIEMALM